MSGIWVGHGCVILLLHRTSTQVFTGRQAVLESAKQFYSRPWHLGRDGWQVRLSCVDQNT